MTKAKALREYFKKFYNVDVSGMSEVGALRNFFKQKYDYDSTGSTVSSVLSDVVNSDIEPSSGTNVERCTIVGDANTRIAPKFLYINGDGKMFDAASYILSASKSFVTWIIGEYSQLQLENIGYGELRITDYTTHATGEPPKVVMRGSVSYLRIYHGTSSVTVTYG